MNTLTGVEITKIIGNCNTCTLCLHVIDDKYVCLNPHTYRKEISCSEMSDISVPEWCKLPDTSIIMNDLCIKETAHA